jgi:DNA polymerase-3 subunit gamma/tau
MENNYTALYRKYRPRTFDDVVGQDVVVKTLKNSIINKKIAHAYLFAGPRGTGKTSVAKILAAAVNCEGKSDNGDIPCMSCDSCLSIKKGNNPDIIEMDAASNRGIDDIRSIIEKVKYRPLQSKYKVYIIDEVHMLTKDSFNALLKTLEEPPEHTIFILATTEPLKILTTIISRCQRYDFSRVDDKDIVSRLEHVIKFENKDNRPIEYEKDALKLIADLSNGGVRDALSILDQCLAYNNDKVLESSVNDIYGITTKKSKLDLVKKVYNKDVDYVVRKIREYNDSGIDIKKLTEDLVNIYKESFIYTTCNNSDLLNVLSITDAKELTKLYNSEELMKCIEILMEVMPKYDYTKNVSDYFEVSLLKVMALKNVINKVDLTEEKIIIRNYEEKSETKTEDINEITVLKKEHIKVDEKADILVIENNFVQNENLDREEIEFISDDNVIEKLESNSIDLSFNFYLSILVSANKIEKEHDIEAINTNKSNSFEVSKMKYSNLLNEIEIVASAKDVILVEVGLEAVANQINEGEFNKGIYEYFRNDLNIDKMIYAITKGEKGKLINLFRVKNSNNELPEPVIITKYRIVEEKVEDINLEDRLVNIFGEDKVIIKEKL